MAMRLVFAPACGALIGGLLLAPSSPVPGPTAPPTTCKAVMYHATLAAIGTIRPVSPGVATPGQCSQITLTAWRNNYDYNCNDPRTAHETTTAAGPDLNNCSYDLPVEMGHAVVLKATTTIPTWRVVLPYNNKSETSPSIWEEKHPVTINWVLKKNIIIVKPQPVPVQK
jgi:hypothetical protein